MHQNASVWDGELDRILYKRFCTASILQGLKAHFITASQRHAVGSKLRRSLSTAWCTSSPFVLVKSSCSRWPSRGVTCRLQICHVSPLLFFPTDHRAAERGRADCVELLLKAVSSSSTLSAWRSRAAKWSGVPQLWSSHPCRCRRWAT